MRQRKLSEVLCGRTKTAIIRLKFMRPRNSVKIDFIPKKKILTLAFRVILENITIFSSFIGSFKHPKCPIMPTSIHHYYFTFFLLQKIKHINVKLKITFKTHAISLNKLPFARCTLHLKSTWFVGRFFFSSPTFR